jgi:hypothetical protein
LRISNCHSFVGAKVKAKVKVKADTARRVPKAPRVLKARVKARAPRVPKAWVLKARVKARVLCRRLY